MTFRPTTALALLALALAGGALVLEGCGRAPQKAETSATPPPLPDDVQSVEAVAQPPAATASGTDALTAGGRLSLTGELVAPIRSDLVPRTAGRVGRVLVDEGQRVRKGQPLLFTQAAMDRLAGKPEQPSLFDLSDITDNQFTDNQQGIALIQRYEGRLANNQFVGNEAAIFKAVFKHSIVLASLVGLIVMFYAFVIPWIIPG